MSTEAPFFRNATLAINSTYLNVTITPVNGLVISDPSAGPQAAPLYTDAAFGTNTSSAAVFYEISIPLPNVASVPVAINYYSQLTTGQIGTFGAPGGYSQIGYFDWEFTMQPA